MAKMRILWDNLWDTGTLTASSEQSEFPVENTQHVWRKRVWLTDSVTGESVECDLGEDGDVDCILIENHNIPEGSTIEMHGADAPGGSDVVVELDWSLTRIVAFLPATETYRYWRLEIDDPAVPSAAYFEIGRVFIGEYFEFTWQFASLAISLIDPSIPVISDGGQISSSQRDRYRRMDFQWSLGALTQAELEELEAIFQSVGANIPYWICLNADADDPAAKTFYVTNQGGWMFDPLVIERWGFALPVEEAR